VFSNAIIYIILGLPTRKCFILPKNNEKTNPREHKNLGIPPKPPRRSKFSGIKIHLNNRYTFSI
jgi:hypothetical protein